MLNKGFDGGVWHRTHSGVEYDNIYVPEGWTAFWNTAASYGRPEMKCITAVPPYLDPLRIHTGTGAVQWFTMWRTHDAGLYQQVAVVPGTRLRFSAWAHAWSSQQDDPHYSTLATADDRRNFTFTVGIDPTGGTNPWGATVVWGAGANIYDIYAQIPAVEVVATGEVVTAFIRSVVLWPFKHCDAYIDTANLEVVDLPDECYGTPREDYARRYNVYPTDATEARRLAIAAECARIQQTCGPSYDDAGIGDLSDKTAVLWDIPAARRADFLDFYRVYYPGTIVEFAGDSPEPPTPLRLTYPTTHLPPRVTQPFIEGQHGGIDLASSWAIANDEAIAAFDGVVINDTAVYHATFGYFVLTHTETTANVFDLRYAHLVNPPYVKQGDRVTRGQKLGRCDNTGTSTGDHLHFSIYLNGRYVDPAPLIDWPIDPTPPDPPLAPIRPAGTRGHILLHWTPTTAAGVQNYAQTIRPPALKLTTGGGDGDKLVMVRNWSPSTLLVHRRVENGLDRYNPATTAPYVQRYVADLSPHFNLSDFSQPPIYIVSINEIYECGATANNQAAVAWDIAFMEAVEATGLNLKAVVYTAPVGNPHVTPADLSVLLPMVRKAVAGKHLLGKHCYYASAPDRPAFYQDSWLWYGGRFAQDDAYFVSQGLRPYWVLGEGGACMATVYPTAMSAFAMADFSTPVESNWPNRFARIRRDANGEIEAIETLRGLSALSDYAFSITATQSDEAVSLNPGAGWRACGSIQRYRDELLWAEAWYKNWNAANQGRLLGVCLFTTGGWGWEQFDLQGADLDVVTAGLAGVL